MRSGLNSVGSQELVLLHVDIYNSSRSVLLSGTAVYSRQIKSEKIIKWDQLLNGSAAHPSQGVDSGRQARYQVYLVPEGLRCR